MYADENRRAEASKVGVTKATKSTAVHSNTIGTRKAFADVGNLAGAMSKGCSMKTEPQERAFGTNLSNADGKKAAADKLSTKGQKSVSTRSAKDQENDLNPTILNGPKSSVARNSRAKLDSQSMTATLTSTAEEVIDGMDSDMADDEDVLPDIDSADSGDQLAVADYVADIYKFYKKAEAESIIPADYMHAQADINDKMRGILLDWLVEVHLKFKLMPETLFLTTNLIDRFLAVCSVSRKNLQLVGVTSMLLASKYEEIWAPEVKDFVYISDNAYTKDQILAMEKLMLNTLKFNLTVPTPFVFTARFLKAAQAEREVQHAAWFFVELSLPDYTMLRFSPSHVAAASVYLAIRTVAGNVSGGDSDTVTVPEWDGSVLQRHTGLQEQQIRLCVSLLIGLHQKSGTGNLTAVHKKYSASKFSSVAQLTPATLAADDEASQC